MRYNSIEVDPELKREMTTYSKEIGDEQIEYNILEINSLFLGDGRVDILAYMVYGSADLWYLIMDKNWEYTNPFDLLDKNFELNDLGKKYIKIPVSSQFLEAGIQTSTNTVENSLDI